MDAHLAAQDYRPPRDYPIQCEKCNKFARLHGHHWRYAEAFNTIYLCPSCHIRVDTLMKRMGITPHDKDVRIVDRTLHNLTLEVQGRRNEQEALIYNIAELGHLW